MSLIKQVTQDTGAVAEYWNIGAIEQDLRNKAYTVTLYGYASEAARHSSLQPLAAKKFQIAAGDDFKPDLTREDLYAIIKELPEFEGAEDA